MRVPSAQGRQKVPFCSGGQGVHRRWQFRAIYHASLGLLLGTSFILAANIACSAKKPELAPPSLGPWRYPLAPFHELDLSWSHGNAGFGNVPVLCKPSARSGAGGCMGEEARLYRIWWLAILMYTLFFAL
jgi:hypothetical protein